MYWVTVNSTNFDFEVPFFKIQTGAITPIFWSDDSLMTSLPENVVQGKCHGVHVRILKVNFLTLLSRLTFSTSTLSLSLSLSLSFFSLSSTPSLSLSLFFSCSLTPTPSLFPSVYATCLSKRLRWVFTPVSPCQMHHSMTALSPGQRSERHCSVCIDRWMTSSEEIKKEKRVNTSLLRKFQVRMMARRWCTAALLLGCYAHTTSQLERQRPDTLRLALWRKLQPFACRFLSMYNAHAQLWAQCVRLKFFSFICTDYLKFSHGSISIAKIAGVAYSCSRILLTKMFGHNDLCLHLS